MRARNKWREYSYHSDEEYEFWIAEYRVAVRVDEVEHTLHLLLRRLAIEYYLER